MATHPKTTPIAVMEEKQPTREADIENLLRRLFCVRWQKEKTHGHDNGKQPSHAKARKKFEHLAKNRRSHQAVARADEFWNSCNSHFHAIQSELLQEDKSSRDMSNSAVRALSSKLESNDAKVIFKASDFRLLNKIGKGGYGSVYKALHQPTGHIVALKQLDRDSSSVETHDHRMLPLDCGVVPCYGTFRAAAAAENNETTNILKADLRHWMVLKLCSASLRDRLRAESGPLPNKEAAMILRKVAKTVMYLYYTHGIVHNDIKAENILFDGDGHSILLCDLGVAQKCQQQQQERPGGAYSHMAPEKLAARKGATGGAARYHNDEKIDVWSMGVLLHEMVFRAHPFEEFKDVANCPTIHGEDDDSTKLDRLMQAYNTLSLPKQCNTGADGLLLKDMLQSLLAVQPNERTSLTSLVDHPWMKRHGTLGDRAVIKVQSGLSAINNLIQRCNPKGSCAAMAGKKQLEAKVAPSCMASANTWASFSSQSTSIH
ncbi:TRAF2 and NCK-interacting protein kinase [Seminavis robusta]|uniref:mitogen-activated protein kinase kinase n=1 Tax=Seminavis robusta TaxID=568900 RepID=A0A9N8DIH8_9STRA|nr:TRAF2 and NCK-interacting protein kinase [Seminavis robusta]|eukprot:Sro145_g067190.1 TRAF2 and NCK-interacting protein kinase (488) ;mRNA; f:10656-12119